MYPGTFVYPVRMAPNGAKLPQTPACAFAFSAPYSAADSQYGVEGRSPLPRSRVGLLLRHGPRGHAEGTTTDSALFRFGVQLLHYTPWLLISVQYVSCIVCECLFPSSHISTWHDQFVASVSRHWQQEDPLSWPRLRLMYQR